MTTNNVTLYDIQAERELIAIILNNPSYITTIQKMVNPIIFYDELVKASYLACIELFLNKNRITLQDLSFDLKSKNFNNWYEVLEYNTSRTSMDAKELIYYLVELKGKRDMFDMAKKINNGIMSNSTYQELLQIVNSETTNEYFAGNDDLLDMSDILLTTVNSIGDVMTNGHTVGVPTGYPSLDRITGGWLNGNLILFAGRPGQGKTITLLEHSRHASAQGFPVLFLSLEMPVQSLIYRMISGTLDDGTSYAEIKTGKIDINKYNSISGKVGAELGKLPITWYDGASRDINYLSRIVQKVVQEKKIKMVVIDYLQLITDSEIRNKEEIAQVSSVSKKLQQLSKKLNVPFLIATQLNRASESRANHRPKLADLRSSGQIEQDASVVIGLYRDDYYKWEKAKEENSPMVDFDNKIEYIFLKNRDGDTRFVELGIDVKTSRIFESHSF